MQITLPLGPRARGGFLSDPTGFIVTRVYQASLNRVGPG